ncbi:MAG: LysM domain-containing protein [Actinomycetota bacterium]
MAATLAPYTVVVPLRLAGGRRHTRVFVRRRLLVSLVLVAVVAVVWLGAGNVLANRGGDPASAATVRPASPAAHVYVARAGDTLWSLAQRFHGDTSAAQYLELLLMANRGSSLQVGQAVTLP